MAEVSYLASTLLMGLFLIVVATVLTRNERGPVPGGADGNADREQSVGAGLGEMARNPRAWILGFVLLTAGITVGVLLYVGGGPLPDEGREIAGLAVAGLLLLVTCAFLFLGTYLTATSTGRSSAWGLPKGQSLSVCCSSSRSSSTSSSADRTRRRHERFDENHDPDRRRDRVLAVGRRCRTAARHRLLRVHFGRTDDPALRVLPLRLDQRRMLGCAADDASAPGPTFPMASCRHRRRVLHRAGCGRGADRRSCPIRPRSERGFRVVMASPGWGPAVAYTASSAYLVVVPYLVIGYGSLAYLVYATVLKAAEAAVSGLLGLASCVGCAFPVIASLVAGLAGGSSALTAAVYAFSIDISTAVFVLAVGLLYWRPGFERYDSRR
ncbi:DUF7546 family protein [Halalkalicoccus salilacus]|uniref:DUF7546 family protein n=1 Tax=Halalkalicoccus sp. GCM10025704 TaxID=3252662 RepID=UPI00360FECA5